MNDDDTGGLHKKSKPARSAQQTQHPQQTQQAQKQRARTAEYPQQQQRPPPPPSHMRYQPYAYYGAPMSRDFYDPRQPRPFYDAHPPQRRNGVSVPSTSFDCDAFGRRIPPYRPTPPASFRQNGSLRDIAEEDEDEDEDEEEENDDNDEGEDGDRSGEESDENEGEQRRGVAEDANRTELRRSLTNGSSAQVRRPSKGAASIPSRPEQAAAATPMPPTTDAVTDKEKRSKFAEIRHEITAARRRGLSGLPVRVAGQQVGLHARTHARKRVRTHTRRCAQEKPRPPYAHWVAVSAESLGKNEFAWNGETFASPTGLLRRMNEAAGRTTSPSLRGWEKLEVLFEGRWRTLSDVLPHRFRPVVVPNRNAPLPSTAVASSSFAASASASAPPRSVDTTSSQLPPAPRAPPPREQIPTEQIRVASSAHPTCSNVSSGAGGVPCECAAELFACRELLATQQTIARLPIALLPDACRYLQQIVRAQEAGEMPPPPPHPVSTPPATVHPEVSNQATASGESCVVPSSDAIAAATLETTLPPVPIATSESAQQQAQPQQALPTQASSFAKFSLTRTPAVSAPTRPSSAAPRRGYDASSTYTPSTPADANGYIDDDFYDGNVVGAKDDDDAWVSNTRCAVVLDESATPDDYYDDDGNGGSGSSFDTTPHRVRVLPNHRPRSPVNDHQHSHQNPLPRRSSKTTATQPLPAQREQVPCLS